MFGLFFSYIWVPQFSSSKTRVRNNNLIFPTAMFWLKPAHLPEKCNVRKLRVPGDWKAFRLPLKNARKAWRMCVFPMGHICTFVPNGKSLYVCFSVLWNEALVVIKLILSSLWQLIQFLWEMKATANMFWINSITLKKRSAFNYYLGICRWCHVPCANMRNVEKTNQGSFFFSWWCSMSQPYLSINKCLFNIILSLKEKVRIKKWELVDAHVKLTWYWKNCSGIPRVSEISQKRKNKIKPSKGLFQRNYSILWTSSKF